MINRRKRLLRPRRADRRAKRGDGDVRRKGRHQRWPFRNGGNPLIGDVGDRAATDGGEGLTLEARCEEATNEAGGTSEDDVRGLN
jgi:hypothetical protein